MPAGASSAESEVDTGVNVIAKLNKLLSKLIELLDAADAPAVVRAFCEGGELLLCGQSGSDARVNVLNLKQSSVQTLTERYLNYARHSDEQIAASAQNCLVHLTWAAQTPDNEGTMVE